MRQLHRRSVARRKMGFLLSPVRAPLCVMDPLEQRRLLSGEAVVTPITPVLASTSNPSSNSITLNQHFFDSAVPGTLVQFSTTEGNIIVSLTDAATPLTVANFLSYVNGASGDNYDGTFFHRSVDLNTGLGGSPTAPATIIQGGGYALQSNGSIGHITTAAPVNDEYQSEILQDTAGTLAMAKTSSPNSATSEWYFNVSDNTELDTPTTVNGVQTSYTVFGTVLSGMSVIQAIAALPTDAVDANAGLTDVPVTGLTETQISANAAVTANNLVFTNSVATEAGTTYTVSSDNKSLVTPSITNGVLSFTYGGGGASGTADITVTATNVWDSTAASTTFAVTVPNSATPSAGPVANPVTAPDVINGKTGSFSVLGSDTDSLAALNPATVTITSAPQHGTAAVNISNGFITYSPAAGYIGSDTLTYTVADEQGNISSAGTVTLNSVPVPLSVTVGGSSGVKSLIYTQPDGISATLTAGFATAVVTFTSYNVTDTVHKGVMTASGPGATITDIVMTNTGSQYAVLKVLSKGPISLGNISDNSRVAEVYAPNATLSGNENFDQIELLDAAAAVNCQIETGSGFYASIVIPNVTNTSVVGNNIESIISKQWLNTNGGTYNVSVTNITNLQVPGTFADGLNLISTNYSIFQANVGTPTAPWDLSGSIYKLQLGTPGSSWGLNAGGEIRTLNIKGNFTNTVTAAAILTMNVSGTSDGAVIQTDATFSSKFNQIQHLTFAKAVTNTVVFSTGNIGSISASSFTGSRVYAGVEIAEAQNGTLATSASNLSNDAKITSFSLGAGANAFSNSLINADLIGSLHLGKIESSNGGTPQGVAAHSIGSISGTLVPGGVIKAGPAQLKNAAALAAYETKAKLALGDFAIDLF